MPDIDAGPPALPPDALPAADEAAAPKAWLLVFQYDADSVRLVERKRIEMLAPPDDSALTQQGRAGHWIELRDANGKALYRQVLTQPFFVSAEVHTPHRGATPSHVPVETPEGTFQVVVPDLPEAVDVVFFGLGTPGEQKERAFPTTTTRDFSRAAEAPREAAPMLSAPLEPR